MTNLTYYDTPQALEAAAKSLIIPTDVVLDVGCGIRPQWFFEANTHIGLDAHWPYLDRLWRENYHVKPIHATWGEIHYLYAANAFDTVFALDFIEHLDQTDGPRFINQAIRIARKQVIIFTPIGFYPQSYEPGQKDRWGMDGGYWQTHRSGWQPEDFGEGWQVLACKDYHKYDQYDQPLETPIGAMYCIYTKGG